MLLERKAEAFRRIQQMEARQDINGLMTLVKEEVLNLSANAGLGNLPASSGQYTVGAYLNILNSNPFFIARYLIVEGLYTLKRTSNLKAFNLFTDLINKDISWKESTTEIGCAAVSALGELKDSRAVGYLIPLLKRKEPVARLTASDALAKLKGVEAREALLKAVKKEKDEHTKDHMKNALSEIEPLIQEASLQSEGRKRSWWRF